MYDPDMIAASTLGNPWCRGRNFMGLMSCKQIDAKRSTLKCQHYTSYFTHLKIERQETVTAKHQKRVTSDQRYVTAKHPKRVASDQRHVAA